VSQLLKKIGDIIHEYRLRNTKLKKKGKNVIIMQNFSFSSPESLKIGDDVYIGPDAFINAAGGVQISNGTIIGPRVTIYSVNHRFKDAIAIPYDDILIAKPVNIYENVWIGANVTIVPGVTIGEGCVIGAGAVVTRKFDPLTIIGGNPAKPIGLRNKRHYLRLKESKKIYLKLKSSGLMNPHFI